MRSSGEGVEVQIRETGFQCWLGPYVVFLGKSILTRGCSTDTPLSPCRVKLALNTDRLRTSFL